VILPFLIPEGIGSKEKRRLDDPRAGRLVRSHSPDETNKLARGLVLITPKHVDEETS
jgi:hypothetical protein